MIGDEYYTLEDQLVALRRELYDLKNIVGRLQEDVRMLRYDLDTLTHRS